MDVSKKSLFLLGAGLICFSGLGQAQLLVNESFESGRLPFSISGMSPLIENNLAALGKNSLKIDLSYYSSPINFRQELTNIGVENGTKTFDFGKIYWIGLSVFIPQDFNTETTLGDIVMQMHGTPDSGEDYRNPPLALKVEGNQWEMTLLGDPRMTSVNRQYMNSARLRLGAVEKGKWVRFVTQFRVDWSSTGFVKVFRDGNQVANYNGPVFFNDRVGPYLKVGLYRPAWRADAADWGAPATHDKIYRRSLYLDDLRVGDGMSTLAEMNGGAPGAGSGTSTPGTSASSPAPEPELPKVAPPAGISSFIVE